VQSTRAVSAQLPGHYKKVKQITQTRRCELCRNVLSRYNHGERCFAHKEPRWTPSLPC
jgi:hypothetical protein